MSDATTCVKGNPVRELREKNIFLRGIIINIGHTAAITFFSFLSFFFYCYLAYAAGTKLCERKKPNKRAYFVFSGQLTLFAVPLRVDILLRDEKADIFSP